MARREELEEALLEPSEDLSFEYKTWLDLNTNHGKATLAKAVIAMANTEGGYVVIGYDEEENTLRSIPKPDQIREFTQDLVNAAVQRYVSPPLHVRMEVIENTRTAVRHPVVVVPSTAITPVMAMRDCEGVLHQARVYVRQPGPRSEEPRTVDEWRILLDRCVQRSRSTMLDAIRSIVEGRVEERDPPPALQDSLAAFVTSSREQHEALLDAAELPDVAVARMPRGRYEIGFAFDGGDSVPSLANLRQKIEQAHRIKLTGWPSFLTMTRQEMAPYVSGQGIEAWIGRPSVDRYFDEDPAHCDFWRITSEGLLYTTTGFDEDGIPDQVEPGMAIDLTLPVWRIGEAVLFARRLASEYEGVEGIATRVRWSGLEGRTLRTINGNRAPMSYDRTSRTPEAESSLMMTLAQIDDNLPEILHTLLAPFYEVFDFYELPRVIVEQELGRLMRQN